MGCRFGRRRFLPLGRRRFPPASDWGPEASERPAAEAPPEGTVVGRSEKPVTDDDPRPRALGWSAEPAADELGPLAPCQPSVKPDAGGGGGGGRGAASNGRAPSAMLATSFSTPSTSSAKVTWQAACNAPAWMECTPSRTVLGDLGSFACVPSGNRLQIDYRTCFSATASATLSRKLISRRKCLS